MRGLRIGTAAAAWLAMAGGAFAQIELSEIRVDQPSTDLDEYFEIEGRPGDSLDGVTYVVIGDGTSSFKSGVIETAIDLTGLVIPADGFFLAVEDTFTLVPLSEADLVLSGSGNGINFENSDNVTHLLVSGFTGSIGSDYDADDDCVLDSEPWTAVIDKIALIKEENPPVTTECHYGPPTLGPDGVFVPGHALRLAEGDHTWFIGQFSTVGGSDTPGRENARRTEWVFEMGGDQEVPPNDSTAVGSCLVALSSLQKSVILDCTHDVVGPTAAHIHNAPAGVSGPVVFDLGTGASPIHGDWTTITPEQVTELLAGNMYVNVHSDLFPGGEIRGQIVNPPSCSGLETLTLKCAFKRDRFVLKAIVKNGTPGMILTFRLDGDSNTDLQDDVNDRGKAKAKFDPVAQGAHTVDELECGLNGASDCQP